MKKFWEIINHDDAVQIKFEVAKSLRNFTSENTKEDRARKKRLLDEIGQTDNSENVSKEDKEKEQIR